MPFEIGENVGVYRIVGQLGRGGMATVFKAYHPTLDRYVAIKVLHPAFTQDPGFLTRFQREARIVARLDHPNIVSIYDFSEHRGHPYLVMRFVEGETLKARMWRDPLDATGILTVTQAVGRGLGYAHRQGVLHRDIKPSNILLSADGGVYLTDFGVARMAEAGESTISRDMLTGTPQYISPEQARGVADLDLRTDIYSLGVVLYELLVGQVPFSADTPYAIIHDHIFSPLPLPRSRNPSLPEAVERVLLKALAKKPEDRFQTAEVLTAALEVAFQAPAGTPPTEAAAAAAQTRLYAARDAAPAPTQQQEAGVEVAPTALYPSGEAPPGPVQQQEADVPVAPTELYPSGEAAAGRVVAPKETVVAAPPTPAPPLETVAMPEERRLPREKERERAEKKPEKKRKEKGKKRVWPWLVASGVVGLVLILAILGLVAVNQGWWSAAFPIPAEATPADAGPAEPTPEEAASAEAAPAEAEQLLKEARAAREAGDPARALTLYEQAVAADPQLVSAYVEGTELLIGMRDTERAREFMLEGLEANPDDPGLHGRLAEMAILTGQWDLADREVGWLLREMPETPLPHAYAAILILGQGGPCGEAAPELEAALHFDQDLAWAHYGLALCAMQEENVEEARAELRFVLGQDEIRAGLRRSAEQLLEELGPEGERGVEEGRTVEEGFGKLFALAEQIPEGDDLRPAFSEFLEHSTGAWDAGSREEAIEILHQAKGWVEEHWEPLGDDLATALFTQLDRTIGAMIES